MATKQGMQAIVTYSDGTQETFPNEQHPSLLDIDLTEYGTVIEDIKLKDPDKGVIDIDNGMRVVYGEPRANRSWICTQGLWMYYDNSFTSHLSENQIYGRDAAYSWNNEQKIYTNFTLTNVKDSSDNDFSGNFSLKIEANGNNRKCILQKELEDTPYIGYISNAIKESGSPQSAITLGFLGVYFNAIQICSAVPGMEFGYVKVIPRWVGYNKATSSRAAGYYPSGTASSVNSGNSYLIYFTNNLGLQGTLESYYRSYAPVLGSEGNYLIIPFKNENEYNYAMGITDSYKKMSKEEFEEYIKGE